jgi:hypothetical protein
MSVISIDGETVLYALTAASWQLRDTGDDFRRVRTAHAAKYEWCAVRTLRFHHHSIRDG